MMTVIKWVFILVLAAVTAVTIITIMINQTIKTERMPEDEKLTEITSAGHLVSPYNSVSRIIIIWKYLLKYELRATDM